MALSIALLLQRSANPHVARIGRVGDTEHHRNVDRHTVHCAPGVLALRIDESLVFTNARRLVAVVDRHLAALPDTRRVVLLMSPVNAIDYSALEALRALHELLAERASARPHRGEGRCSTACAPAAGSAGSAAACSSATTRACSDEGGQGAA